MITLVAKSDYGKTGQYIARIFGIDLQSNIRRQFIGVKANKRLDTTEAEVNTPGLYECCDVGDEKIISFVVVVNVNGRFHELQCDKEQAIKIAKLLEKRSFSQTVVGYEADTEAYNISQRVKLLRKFIVKDQEKLNSEIRLEFNIATLTAGSVVKLEEIQPLIKDEVTLLERRLKELAKKYKFPRHSFRILKDKESDKVKSLEMIESAITECRRVLKGLPEKDVSKVIAALRIKIVDVEPEVVENEVVKVESILTEEIDDDWDEYEKKETFGGLD